MALSKFLKRQQEKQRLAAVKAKPVEVIEKQPIQVAKTPVREVAQAKEPDIQTQSLPARQTASDSSYWSFLITLLLLSTFSYVLYRYGWDQLRLRFANATSSHFSPDNQTETITMSENTTAVLADFAPSLASDTEAATNTTQATFDVSNMKLHLRREQRQSMTGTVTYSLHLFVDMTEGAKKAIKHYGFGNQIIYTKKPIIGADSAWAKINPWQWIMHIIWWLFTRKLHTVCVKELVSGKTLKCKDIIEMVEIEDQIFEAIKGFSRIMYTAAFFEGEVIYNIDQEIGMTPA